MPSGRPVFAQIMEFIPSYEFTKLVEQYRGNYRARTFTCWDQLLCMSFAQLSYRESLRDIVACLTAQPRKLYHLGIRGTVARSNLARANATRDWRIYADLAAHLIATARPLYQGDDDFLTELNATVYALDSTTVDLCLTQFPWAQFRQQKAAVKLHTLLDLQGPIPTVVHITTGRVHDVNILDRLLPEPGAYYIMDRGYIDYERLYTLHQAAAFFVIRAKKNLQFRRLYSRAVEKATGLRCDQTIALTGVTAQHDYPVYLRRVKVYYAAHQRHLVFLTNNFRVDAHTIATLYRSRWQVELFFKWIKQHLRIQSFYGTSTNAVKTQIWIAVCTYVVIAIIKKTYHVQASLYTMLQILSVTLFEKVSLKQLLTEMDYENDLAHLHNQLKLFDF